MSKPTEQDKELREAIYGLVRDTARKYHEAGGFWYGVAHDNSEAIMQLITADRKRVALEARLDENEEWRLFSKEAQRGILPTDFKARMITLKEPYQLSEAQQEEA